LIDGILWRIQVGAPWRDVPPQYGSWSAVYALFRRWQRDGTWKQLLTALQTVADNGRQDYLGRVGGLDQRPRPPARGRGG
jgi:transposase